MYSPKSLLLCAATNQQASAEYPSPLSHTSSFLRWANYEKDSIRPGRLLRRMRQSTQAGELSSEFREQNLPSRITCSQNKGVMQKLLINHKLVKPTRLI